MTEIGNKIIRYPSISENLTYYIISFSELYDRSWILIKTKLLAVFKDENLDLINLIYEYNSSNNYRRINIEEVNQVDYNTFLSYIFPEEN